ncbi:hypothetical protein ASG73_00495 [Janibacter sp. Soil728]|uniref:hypothetical protein n=1 Tax=Janibacter sp. Soil728 TaxID=1736393 RepID=UPI0006FBEC05|nr:hypothetical protein [Janibacter sp. Soil728]KRE38887.1 hypothetical protein ASG73_00495 [Janibacter sp. Soil728]
MSHSIRTTMLAPRARRAGLAGLVAALLALAMMVLAPPPTSSADPTSGPTGVAVKLATTQPGVGGAVPDVLAQAGVTPISLTLTLTGDQPSGPTPTFTSDATFALDVSLAGGGTPHGSVSPDQVVLPAGEVSTTTTITYSAADNGVVITPRLTGDLATTNPLTATASDPFVSLKRLTVTPAGPGATTIGAGACTADSADLGCATVLLPKGTVSSVAVTTVGACTQELQCPDGSEVVGFIADLGTLYTRDAPAQIVIRCDASRCGQGAIHKYVAKMTFDATGPLDITSQPCVAKGVADDGHGNAFCTDYVSSSRNQGDLLLVVNVLGDYRGAV